MQPIEATSGDRVERANVIDARGDGATYHLWLIPGFHYDPVWWNTQSNYLAAGDGLRPERDGAFGLIDGYLRACREDPDYKFVLEQVPYLKPYWDAHPSEREFIRELVVSGRLQVLGAMHCEVQTNLIGAESNARAFLAGCRYMESVYGAEQNSAWQCDCFGHDPNFAQYCAEAGLKWASFARAAFHHFGVSHDEQNIPSEFRWMGPDGSEILTHYMSGHYDYYYKRLKGKPQAEFDALLTACTLDLSVTAATHNICVPLLGDFGPAIPELAERCRAFNDKYAGIQARVATFDDFTRAVEDEIASRDIYLPPIARDFNPVLSGCNLTFQDTKQAQRAAENELLTAETIAAVAGIFGAKYPSADFSRAWRQLLFCAHHDAITGSEGGEVYLHLLSSWRTAWDIGKSIKGNGLTAFMENVDTKNGPDGASKVLLIFNPHSFASSGPIEIEIDNFPAKADYVVVDADGNPIPTECERSADSGMVRFTANDIPPLGWKTYWLKTRARRETMAEVIAADEATIENRRYKITIDASRGGCLTSIFDKQLDRELLKPGGLGAEVVVRGEYPGHTRFPLMGEGPAWLIHTNGKLESTAGTPANLSMVATETRRTIIADAPFGTGIRRMIYTLFTEGPDDRLDIAVEIGGYRGMDELITLDFDFDLDGAMPFSEVSNFVIGRTPGWWENIAEDKFPHNFACHRFCGLGSPFTVTVPAHDRNVTRSHAVGEIVFPADPKGELREHIDELVHALFSRGISTTAVPDDERPYGDRRLDSNLPDFRIILGGAKMNARARALSNIDSSPLSDGEIIYLNIGDDIPIILLNASRPEALMSLIKKVSRQIRLSASLNVDSSNLLESVVSAPDWGVALFNRGNIDFIADGEGRLSLSLYRAIAAEPGFRWMHPPERRLPDGTICQSQHWSHRYEFSLTAFDGDWFDAELGRKASQFNRPPSAIVGDVSKGTLPPEWSLLTEPADDWELSCFKGLCPPDYEQKAADVDVTGRCILRLYESRGEKAKTELGFSANIRAAYESNLLEENSPDALNTEGDRLSIALGNFEMRTFAIDYEATDELQAVDLGLPADPPPPHFSAYWHHDRHEAPTGNSLQSLIFKQRIVRLGHDNAATIGLAVTNSTIDVPFQAKINVFPPEGFSCEPLEFDVSLPPSGSQEFELRLEADGEPSGVRWLRAEMDDINGNRIYDIVPIGETTPDDFPIEINLENDTIGIEPGTATELGLKVKNISRDILPVHIELICPIETWEWFDEFERAPFYLAPDEERQIQFKLQPNSATTKGNYFAFFKIMAGDMSRFTEPIDIWHIDGGTAYLLEGRRELLPGEPCTIGVDFVCDRPMVTGEPRWKLELPFDAKTEELSREIKGDGIHKARFKLKVTTDEILGEGEYQGVLRLSRAGESFELPISFTAGPYIEVKNVEPLSIEDDYGHWEPELTPFGLLTDKNMRGIRGYNVDDLGVEPRIGWASNGLYVGCRVRDNILDNQHSGANIWRGDCMQVAFKKPNTHESGSLMQTTAEYSFALTDAGLISFCHHNLIGEPRIEADGDVVDFPLRVERVMQETFYEAFIPASAFGVDALQAGDLIRFNIVMNDADGQGWKGAAEWARGTVLVKDPDAYGVIRLVD